MMKNFVKYIVFAAATVCLAACSEDFMDNINKDTSHPLDVNAKFLITDIEMRTAQNMVGGDFNTYFGAYVEHWVGTHNQLYQAEIRGAEVRVSSTFNNTWGTVYENIRNAKIVVAKCSEGGSEESNKLAKAVGEILLAYNAAAATDIYGDTPYTQVGNYKEYPAPAADKQSDIYTEVFKLLDDAIACLEGASNTLGSYDIIYGGDPAKWKKFAQGLKARYTMRLILKSSSKETDYQKVIDCANASFASADEQASVKVYDGTSAQNPVFDFEWSRDGISSSTSMYQKLMERKDPRADRIYYDPSAWSFYDSKTAAEHLAPNGEPEESQYNYCYDAFFFAEVAPVHLLSYHEVLFLKAEAQCRLNNNDTKATLKKAVEAAFVNFENNVQSAQNAPTVNSYGGLAPLGGSALDAAAADTYFESNVAPLFEANPFKEVMIQKYIALWGANGESVETYNDIRRLKAEGKDIYSLANKGKFPLRAAYGNDDVVNNPNISSLYTDAGNYVFSENVWWAGGSR